MPAFRLPVRQLVEFLLRTGSIDSRFTGFDRANEGARIHRRLQKAAGEGYAAEVFLSGEREVSGITFTIEGRADGIFSDEAGVTVIDEIKTTAVPADAIAEDMNPCHWAQGMVYGAGWTAGSHTIRSIPMKSSASCGISPSGNWKPSCKTFSGSTPLGRSASWRGRSAGARASRRWPSLFRPIGPGSGRWQARSTAPAPLHPRRRASGSSVRPPPASARP